MFEKVPNPAILPGDGYGATRGSTVAFSSNGKLLFASGSGGNTSGYWQTQGTVYDLTSGAPVFKTRLSGAPTYSAEINRMAVSFNNSWLAVAAGLNVYIYNIHSNYPEAGDITYSSMITVTGMNTISMMEYSYDDRYLAVGSGYTSPYFRIYRVNQATGALTEVTGIVSLPSTTIYDIKFSQDNKWLVVTTTISTSISALRDYIWLYNLESDFPVRITIPTLTSPGTGNYFIRGANFSADSKYLYITATNNYIHNFDITSGSPVLINNLDLNYTPTYMSTSFGNKYLCIGTITSAYYLRIYSIGDDGSLTLEMPPSILPPSTINDIRFSLDGRWMAVAHNNGPYITIYNTASQILEDFKEVVNITPDFPLSGKINIPIDLTGTVSPTDATTKVIHWTIVNQGGTSSEIVANRLYAKKPGTVRIRATVLNGSE